LNPVGVAVVDHGHVCVCGGRHCFLLTTKEVISLNEISNQTEKQAR